MSAQVSFLWHLGDGTVSREQELTALYLLPGVYEVYCEITDNYGNTWISNVETIRVYDHGYEIGEINVSKTTQCVRHAIPQEPAQGIGWSEYDGVVESVDTMDWPRPEAVVGTCQVVDDSDDSHQLVLDAYTWRWFEIGASDQWLDGEDAYGGTETEAEVLFRENVPTVRAAAKLKHRQSHLFVAPWNKYTRNTTRYDSNGFPRSMEIDLFVRKDGGITDDAIAKEVPRKGQIVFDRHIESESLQMGCKIRGAPWRLPEVQMWYKQIDTAAPPVLKQMSEKTWAAEYSGPLLWLTRDVDPSIDHASAAVFGGSYSSVTTGPDGLARSAVLFGSSDAFWLTSIGALSGDFALYTWVKNPTSGADLFTFANGGRLRISQSGGSWLLNWDDGTNDIDFMLATAPTAWTQLVVMRSGANLVCYQNGVIVNTVALSNPNLSYSGRVTLASSCALYGARVLGSALSGDAILWAYNDVVQNSGDATEPPL